MFEKKQKRIQELEMRIEGYLYREVRLRKKLNEKEEEIQSLTKKITNADEIKTLKEIRIEKGMTQKQVAEKIGIKTTQYISEIERGIHIPSFKFICKLASLYELTPAQIVESLTIDGWGVSYGHRK